MHGDYNIIYSKSTNNWEFSIQYDHIYHLLGYWEKHIYIYFSEGLMFKFQWTTFGFRKSNKTVKHPGPMLYQRSSTRCPVFSHLSYSRVHNIGRFPLFFSTNINLLYKNFAIFINNVVLGSQTRTSVILTF